MARWPVQGQREAHFLKHVAIVIDPGFIDPERHRYAAGQKRIKIGGPALEPHAQIAAACLDARDVAEAHHERPVKVDVALHAGDLDPEDLDGTVLGGSPLVRHVGGPRILLLCAVEVVAPERLLVASPAQAPLVGGAVDGGDAPVDQPLVIFLFSVNPGLRRRWGRERGSCGRGRPVVVAERQVAGGHGDENEHGNERPDGNPR